MSDDQMGYSTHGTVASGGLDPAWYITQLQATIQSQNTQMQQMASQSHPGTRSQPFFPTGWRPPPPVEEEVLSWNAPQAYRIADTLRIAAEDADLVARFPPRHLTDLAADVTLYGVAVEILGSRPGEPKLTPIDFGRLFSRLLPRVRDALGAERTGTTCAVAARASLEGIVGIPLPTEPVSFRRRSGGARPAQRPGHRRRRSSSRASRRSPSARQSSGGRGRGRGRGGRL